MGLVTVRGPTGTSHALVARDAPVILTVGSVAAIVLGVVVFFQFIVLYAMYRRGSPSSGSGGGMRYGRY